MDSFLQRLEPALALVVVASAKVKVAIVVSTYLMVLVIPFQHCLERLKCKFRGQLIIPGVEALDTLTQIEIKFDQPTNIPARYACEQGAHSTNPRISD